MKRDPEFFGDRELTLIYIGKRLKEALRLEDALTRAGIDYGVEVDTYRGGLIFVTERHGAFFYVAPEHEAAARDVMRRERFRPAAE